MTDISQSSYSHFIPDPGPGPGGGSGGGSGNPRRTYPRGDEASYSEWHPAATSDYQTTNGSPGGIVHR